MKYLENTEKKKILQIHQNSTKKNYWLTPPLVFIIHIYMYIEN